MEQNEKKGLTPLDKVLINIIENHIYEIAVAVIVLFSLVIRYKLITFKFNGDYISGDFRGFLRVWVDYYRELGVREGLSRTIGDYYVPYNIILAIISVIPIFDEGIWISVVSVFGEYLGALFMFKILNHLTGGNKVRSAFAAAMMLYLPMAMLNGSLWKQCDAFYTSFIFIGLYFFFKKKYDPAFIFFGIAFIFKLQTLFFVPFLIAMYICYHEFSILKFLWFPGLYLAAGIPALICGRSPAATYLVYFRQTDVAKMSIGFPNIYILGIDSYEAMTVPALMITLTVLVLIACFLMRRRDRLDERLMFAIAGFFVMTCVMFLPAMHERYDYLAIIILSMYALAIDLKLAPTAVIMNLCPIFTYGSYLFHMGDNLLNYQHMSLMYLFAYLYAAWYLYRRTSLPAEKEKA